MKPKSGKILLFAILFTVLFLTPAFASGQYKPYELLKNGDIIDLFTPLILIPLYWSLYRPKEEQPSRSFGVSLFLIFAALWVMGHSMHLAANAIKHLLTDLTPADAEYLSIARVARDDIDLTKTEIYALTDNFDERLGHLIWHSGILGLAAVLLVGEFRHHAGQDQANMGLIVPAGILHGLTLFTIFIEGQTVILGLPFVVSVSAYGLTAGRKWFRRRPLITFFTITAVLAAFLIIGWGLYWGNSDCGWFPEFSSKCVGWLD